LWTSAYALVESNLSGQLLMRITRHYLAINGRRVHYRRAGKGPPLLMVHQSPRSGAEYEALMLAWGAHFTCIAPDTPGFGQSDALAPKSSGRDPDINDYADAVVEFARALGLTRTAAYGFHSGGIILVSALKRHPELFSGLAIGGYAIWTPQEMAIFGERYLPPFRPSLFGEHLPWLWHRIMEQSWFFPWFDVHDGARLMGAHDDPARVHAVVMEMLDAGDAYRAGYGAVLRAPRDIPSAKAVTPPVLISAYDGDPLQAHIDRLGERPAGWSATKVASAAEHQALSLAFLQQHAAPVVDHFAEDSEAGFLRVTTDGFDGLIHWQGRGDVIQLHAPGSEGALVDAPDAIRIDLPGHGLSSAWNGAPPTRWNSWMAVACQAADEFGVEAIDAMPITPADPDRLFPDLSPDRHGTYLSTAWSIVRARQFFSPWYTASRATAQSFDPATITPERLALEHRALLRATAARAFETALQTEE
jgi:haloalkane dehalogenase